MPRRPREFMNGGIYHLYNRGNNRAVLFSSPSDFEYFRERLLEAKRKFEVEVFHYCLMSNHFHLLLRIAKGEELARLMHHLQLGYARYFKRKQTHIGHVFQARYRSPLIDRESYYLQCGRYIERNPVEAKIVNKAEAYPYSSAAYYVLGEKDEIITPNLYYEEMGKIPDERRSNYQKFLSIEDPYRSLIAESLEKV